MVRPVARFPWRSALITGASSGIGAAVACELAQFGVDLILCGRDTPRLEAVAARCRRLETRVRTLVVDLATYDGLERLAEEAATVELVVANAGVSQRSRAHETGTAVVRRLFEVDFFAAVRIATTAAPAMVARDSGAIVVVSSVAGLLTTPLRSAYNAAKAAQIAFFGTMANELRHSGVYVGIVIPGFVRTAISENALTADGSRHGRLDDNQAAGISAERAAQRIVAAMARRRRRIVVGFDARLWLLVALRRISPRLLDAILSRVKVT